MVNDRISDLLCVHVYFVDISRPIKLQNLSEKSTLSYKSPLYISTDMLSSCSVVSDLEIYVFILKFASNLYIYSGVFKPGTMNAIMGPTGSGKST